jgi:aminoglycoside phosphotransferase (APT) family kinase protein
VVGARLAGGTSGTSVRRILELTYDAGGRAAGLPERLFVKSTPSVVTRLANGATGTSASEAHFFNELRPQLAGIEAPLGFHSAVDRRFRSVHLLEDLAGRGACFDVPDLRVTRAQAEGAVALLARLHRTFAGRPRPEWLRTYPDWWTAASGIADVRAPTIRYFDGDLAPAELRGRGAEAWEAFVRSVDLHRTLPATVIHADTHPNNWYRLPDGGLGLLDWQCVGHGHWSLDLAYALTTLLVPADRRAWERELIGLYRAESAAPESPAAAWLHYRRQVPGALLKWTPARYSPRGLPEMQPRALAEELLRRISTAMIDLEVLNAY